LYASTEGAYDPRKGVESVKMELLRQMLLFDFPNYELFHLRPIVLDQKLGELSLDLIE